MNFWALCEAIAQAVIMQADRLRYEADAAIAGLNVPRERRADEPMQVVWCGVMKLG